jgi:hypothetical protein
MNVHGGKFSFFEPTVTEGVIHFPGDMREFVAEEKS